MKPVRSTRSAAVASAIAFGTAAVLVVQELVQFMTSLVVNFVYSAGLYDLTPNLGAAALQTLVPVAVLVAGVFLSFWRVAPVTADMPVLRVVWRSVLAAAIGVALTLFGAVLWLLVFSIPFEGSYFGNSFPMPGIDGSAVAQVLFHATANAVTTFVTVSPLVVLAGVLAWIWLARHPREHQVSGRPDEV